MMSELLLHIGLPDEDSLVLLSGFSLPRDIKGVKCRECSKVFRLGIPVCKSGKLRVQLKMRLEESYNLVFYINGKPAAGSGVVCADSKKVAETAGAAKSIKACKPIKATKSTKTLEVTKSVSDDGWTYYNIILAAGHLNLDVDNINFIELKGELDRDPMLPPYSPVYLYTVSLESEDPGYIEAAEKILLDRIAQYPVKLVNCCRSYHEIRKLSFVQKRRVDQFQYVDEKRIYFGDLHIHTNYSMCGYPYNGSIDENIAFAKESGLDFAAVTDHSEHMTPDIWDRYFYDICEAEKKYDIPIIPAVEWTSFEHGHRNIYFPDGKPPFFNSRLFETNHPKKLSTFLEAKGIKAVAAAHHPAYIDHLTDFNSIDDSLENLIEIYSTWGSSEQYGANLEDTPRAMPGCHVRDALARGFKLGFIGGGDVHNTRPGYGGLTAVLCSSLTKRDIFDALYRRRCYATSEDRILLDFHINGYPMGSVISVNQYSINKLFPLDIAASAVCPGPVEKLELVCNGEVIYTKRLRENKSEMDFYLSVSKLSAPGGIVNDYNLHQVNCSRYYYVRITEMDGSMAWSSPIWIDFRYLYD